MVTSLAIDGYNFFKNESVKDESVEKPEMKPQAIKDLDVRQSVLEDLALKILYLSGSLSISELSEKTRLSFEVAKELSFQLRTEMHCQVTGLNGYVPQIAITTQGRARAIELLSHSHYAGPAPVSLQSYVEQVRNQSVKKVDIHADAVQRAFAHLVIGNETLRKFGTALNSGSSIFLYGPPGVGKTTIAETLSRVVAEDAVWIPHAVEVDGQIITVYDPAIHKRIPEL